VSSLILERAVDESHADHRMVGGDRSRLTELHGGLTLDRLITGVWEGLTAHENVSCPVCGEAMAPRRVAGTGVVSGECVACGARLT
jgi:hypothetical protein